MLLLAVGLAGAVGAPARYLTDAFIEERIQSVFPWGTFVINVSGSFLLGVITGLALYHGLGSVPKVVVGTGFCGAYTTFSTFSYETVRLLEDGSVLEAAANTAASLVVGLAGAALGLILSALG
ncbi:MAG TPA: fluoride efflux transporter CrcB [Actinomycetota bacterium]|nr:fluoride efflux transporter CrcB [Actinomycetota bacterium]